MNSGLYKILCGNKIGAEAILNQIDDLQTIGELLNFLAESLLERGIEHKVPEVPASIKEAKLVALNFIKSGKRKYLDSEFVEDKVDTVYKLIESKNQSLYSGYRVSRSITKLLFPGFETISLGDVRGKLFCSITSLKLRRYGSKETIDFVRGYLSGLVLQPEIDLLEHKGERLKSRDLIKLCVRANLTTLTFHRELIPLLIERELGFQAQLPVLPKEYRSSNTYARCIVLKGAEVAFQTRRAFQLQCEAEMKKLMEAGEDVKWGKGMLSNNQGKDLFFHESLLPKVDAVTDWMKLKNYNLLSCPDICQRLGINSEPQLGNPKIVKNILVSKLKANAPSTISILDKNGVNQELPIQLVLIMHEHSYNVTMIDPSGQLEKLITKDEVMAERERTGRPFREKKLSYTSKEARAAQRMLNLIMR